MQNRAQLISIAAVLSLTAGISYAARPNSRPANAGANAPKGWHDCGPKPSEAKCLAEGYLDACGKKWGAVCKAPVESGLETHYNANPSPEITMFVPNRDDIPAGLRQGKSEEYNGPKKGNLLGTFPTVKTTASVGAVAKTTIKPVAKKARRPKLNGTAAAGLAKPRGGALKLSKFKPGKLRVMTSDNVFSRTGLTRPPQSGTGALPVNAHRVPAWDANGAQVKSCEEYGYEQTYDWTRYTDAVAACSGDHNCQIDVAFLPTTPGIADRTLKSKDGTPLKSQIKTTTGFSFPKNDFYAAGSKFARAAGDDPLPMTPDLQALEDALDAGDDYYKIGCKGACRTAQEFSNEWEWHRKLHDGNRTVTEAEFEEYELRKERMRDLLVRWQWAALEDKERLAGKGSRGKAAKFVSPLEQVGNPLQQMRNLRGATRQLGRTAQKLKRGATAAPGTRAAPVNRATPTNRATPVNRAAPTNRAAPVNRAAPTNRRGAVGRVGVLEPVQQDNGLASSVLGFKKPGSTGTTPSSTPAAAKAAATQLAPPKCHPSNFKKGIVELFGRGPISCQIGDLLRDEWRRKQAGERTCLDAGSDDCDWSPMLFERRFVEGVPYIEEQNRAETECLDWTFDKIDQPTLTAATTYIGGQKTDILKALNTLRPYMSGWDPAAREKASPRAFGKGWTDADHFGDKSLFAAGYDYDLGWDIEAVKVENKEVCNVGGGARGGFGVDGWFIGEEFEIVDALARADYGRDGGDNGALDIHLRVFEQDVFPPFDPEIKMGVEKKDAKGTVIARGGKFQGAWEEPLFSGAIQIPPSYKPSFYTMAGPVPISGAVWGEFFYGAKLAVEAVNDAPNCDMSHLEFGVTAAFTPEVGLNAKAQVGVGIAGLLSAGIRGMINLVTVGVPVETTLKTVFKTEGSLTKTDMKFDLDVRLSLETLSGWIAVYVEFLMFEEEFVIFRWNGLGPESVSLLGQPLKVDLPLGVMGG